LKAPAKGGAQECCKQIGLRAALEEALAHTREGRCAHPPGRVFCDLAVMLCDRGRCVSGAA